MPTRMAFLKEARKTAPGGTTDAQGLSKKPFRGRRAPTTQQKDPIGSTKGGKKAFTGSKRDRNGDSRVCHFCNIPGYIARDCRKRIAASAATSEESKK